MRILFGHQSVGQNLLDGVSSLAAEGIPAPVEISAFRVGRNQDPDAKLAHFAAAASSADASDVRLALLKFCYADVTETTNVGALFDRYRRTIDGIRARRSDLAIAHVTVPLRSVASGPTTLLRHLLGRHHPQVLRNQARDDFNERLRRSLAGEPLFDLAALEAQGSDGRRRTTRGPRGPVPVLAPEYTSDGGHLNGAGQRILAQAFLSFLERQRPT